jgi:MFS family permease
MKRSGLLLLAGAPIFCALAIANSAGYRFGVSDLAFYLPAAYRHADPHLFPRDGGLLEVQAELTASDELLGAGLEAAEAAGVGAPAVVYLFEIGGLLLLFFAAIALGQALFASRWSTAALVAALTLRHAVARTGVNTLEGYFQPREVAFALGVLAIAAFLKRGVWPALAILVAAAALHPTTALWFAVMVGVAGLASEPRSRRPLAALGLGTAAAFAWAVVAGPLQDGLVRMDAAWLEVLASRTYLFPDRWPAYAWISNLLYIVLIGLAVWWRRQEGRLRDREAALAAGAGALVAIFVLALPLLAARVALAVQLQPARIFWMLDLLAVVSVIWLIAESGGRQRGRAPAVLAAALIAASLARGVYLMEVEYPERSLAEVAPRSTPWEDAMRWASAHTAADSHWLADPDHAYRYGTSVRVSARRDVFHENSKDPAIAMYDRDLAMRVRERAPAVANFDALTEGAALDLARRYDLDYLVTERRLALPLAYRNTRLYVYDLDSAVKGHTRAPVK